MTDYDTIPVRLPSGRKAFVMLPRPFTSKDAEHLAKFLSEYIESETEPPPTIQFFASLSPVDASVIKPILSSPT